MERKRNPRTNEQIAFCCRGHSGVRVAYGSACGTGAAGKLLSDHGDDDDDDDDNYHVYRHHFMVSAGPVIDVPTLTHP